MIDNIKSILSKGCTAILLLSVLVATAGCIGFMQDGTSEGHSTQTEHPSSTVEDTNGTGSTEDSISTAPVTNGSSNADAKTDDTTDDKTSTTHYPENLTEQEKKYYNSTRWFADTVRRNFHEHRYTNFTRFEGSPKNNVGISTKTTGNASLERSIMDGAELITGIVYHSTHPNESKVNNGTAAPVYEPELVHVNIHGPEGDLLGRYDVDPSQGRAYRRGNITVAKFAQSVMNSYEPVNEYDKRGNQTPQYYLNRSELDVWMDEYRKEFERTNHSFEKPYPTDKLRANVSRFEVLNEFEWSIPEYGQHVVSARAVAWGAYWRTHVTTLARTPERVHIYAHVTDSDKNNIAHMDRQHVYDLVPKIRDGLNSSALRDFQDAEEHEWIQKDENPYEDF